MGELSAAGATNTGNNQNQNVDYTMKLSKCEGNVKNTILIPWDTDYHSLVKELSTAVIGTKDGTYYLRCAGTGRNNSDTADEAHILILDGDSRINEDGVIVSGAPSPDDVRELLTKLDITHVIVPSHSDRATKEELLEKGINSGGAYGEAYCKYRVIIPCVYSREQLPAALDYIFGELHKAGVMLVDVKENSTWSQPWYFPRVPDKARLDQFQTDVWQGL